MTNRKRGSYNKNYKLILPLPWVIIINHKLKVNPPNELRIGKILDTGYEEMIEYAENLYKPYPLNSDKLYHILYTLLYSVHHKDLTDYNNEDNYVILCSKIMNNKYGKDYQHYLRYLKNSNIIESDRYYSTGKCIKYRIKNDFNINNKLKAITSTYCSQFAMLNELTSLTDKEIEEIEKDSTTIYTKSTTIEIKKKSSFGKRLTKNIEYLKSKQYTSLDKYELELYKRFKKVRINKEKAVNYVTVNYNVELSNIEGLTLEGYKNNEIDKTIDEVEYKIKLSKYLSFSAHKLELYLDELIKKHKDKVKRINNYDKSKLQNYKEKLIKNTQNKYDHRINSIHQLSGHIKDGGLHFGRNNTNNRLDTNLTNMASELKQFIIGSKNMLAIDLVNSQPVLFNNLLDKVRNKVSLAPDQTKELDLYIKITINGKWYEYLSEIFSITRNDAKKLWMVIAYSRNGKYNHNEEKLVFASKFPFINEFIIKSKLTTIKEKRKKLNYTAAAEKLETDKPHRKFSIELQRIESRIFIDVIANRLIDAGIVPLTIHDSVIIHKLEVDRTMEIMEDVFVAELGGVPKFGVKGLNE